MVSEVTSSIIQALLTDKESICAEIDHLKDKERLGTLTTSLNTPDTTLLDETNQLDILKGQYDFSVYAVIVQLLNDEYFESLEHLKRYVR